MRQRPLSLAGDPSRVPPDRLAGPIDVIVPVYGAPAAFARCLASLLAHTDLSRDRLVLVLDGPQPPETEALLAQAMDDHSEGVLILKNPERQGFVGAVNLGMAASERDVVLLNSDTAVTADWLGKLQAAAYSAPEIATVTPFSNSATICSLPRFLETNALPAGYDTERFARRIAERSRRAYPRLPTGVGVCLYIKRKALDLLGPFDEASFGLGYGEESEFCMRALKAGFAHALDDATFIYHEGQRSFGTSREGRVAAAHRAMRRLHPEYMATVAAFLRADPVRPLRERVLANLHPPRTSTPRLPERVLHVVHGWPPWSQAGTEIYAAWLARWQAGRREVAVYARIADPERSLGDAVELLDAGVRVRLAVNNFVQRDPLSRNALYDRTLAADLGRLLAEVRPGLVHVHHLAGHALGLLPRIARTGVPIVYQVQDWWAACARANLLDRDRRLCSGPGLGKCSRCLPLTGLSPAGLWNPALYALRGALARRALRLPKAFVMGSRAIADDYLRLGLLRPGDPVHVLPYGVDVAGEDAAPAAPAANALPPRPPARRPLRFGFLGSLLPHKGAHVAVAAFRGVAPGDATLTIHGDPAISPDYAAELAAGGLPPAVRLAGSFPEREKAAVFGGMDVLIVPSLGLESFGLAAREAMACGVPVLASRLGALAEIHAERECGALFTPGSTAELSGWIERLIADPGIVDGWRHCLRESPPVKGLDAHAEEIEEVYEQVLTRRRGP
ncbi:MAG TPA: glycosyltransferase [Thermoanaerobaculia bacterium]|nr:glycosyltransferase [Thermoanaerobaculia bacterium]